MRFAITYIVICFAFIGPALAGDYYAGYAAFKQKDYYNAYREWSELAAKGDKRAQYRLGEMFRSGTGLPVVKIGSRCTLHLGGRPGSQEFGQTTEVDGRRR